MSGIEPGTSWFLDEPLRHTTPLQEISSGKDLGRMYPYVAAESQMFKWLSPPVLRVRTRTATKQLFSFDPHMLDTPKAHVESFKGSLQYQGPVRWNCLAADQRKLTSTSAFTRKSRL
ncbi:hypothetical protein Bbelb_130130 [Branchiostoma belcheri]|nr:hypothetical protein Bbelb_130130 [Branchiostoma belcheri]